MYARILTQIFFNLLTVSKRRVPHLQPWWIHYKLPGLLYTMVLEVIGLIYIVKLIFYQILFNLLTVLMIRDKVFHLQIYWIDYMLPSLLYTMVYHGTGLISIVPTYSDSKIIQLIDLLWEKSYPFPTLMNTLNATRFTMYHGLSSSRFDTHCTILLRLKSYSTYWPFQREPWFWK